MYKLTQRCTRVLSVAALVAIVSTVANTTIAVARPVDGAPPPTDAEALLTYGESHGPVASQRGPRPTTPPCGAACQGNEVLETVHKYGWIYERVLERVCTTRRVLQSLPGAVIGLLTGRLNLAYIVVVVCANQWVTKKRWGRIG
jgi:hypothetical protein